MEWLVLFSDGLVEVSSQDSEDLDPVLINECAMVFTVFLVFALIEQALAEAEHSESSAGLELEQRVSLHKLDKLWSEVGVVLDLNRWSKDIHQLTKSFESSMLDSDVGVHDSLRNHWHLLIKSLDEGDFASLSDKANDLEHRDLLLRSCTCSEFSNDGL